MIRVIDPPKIMQEITFWFQMILLWYLFLSLFQPVRGKKSAEPQARDE